MKSRLLICALALAAPLGGHAYTVVTDEHVDLEVRYSGGVLGGPIRADSGSVPRDEGLLYDGPVGTTSIARPLDPIWNFLGVGAGQPIFFYWPQSSVAGRMYLGFGSDGGAIPPGTFQSYLETDPRVNLTAAWNKITLLDVRYEPTLGVSGSAHFSLWQTDGVGGVDVWMSTFDGGITSTDATWLIEGGHAHYNWGFSKSGYYQIDFRYSGFLAGSGTYIESPTQTFHFGVEYQPPRIPTDIAARGPLSTIGDRPPVDFRINKAGTTGSIELAAGVTSISSLQQNTATAATAGGNLVLDNDDATAALTINAAIANHTTASSVTKTGVGEVHLRGAQNYATLYANEGTTHLHTALGSGTSSLLVASGATAKISASQTLAALTIGAGGTVIFTSGAPSFAGAAVPEPGACALLALGTLGLAARRRRPRLSPGA